MIICVLAAFSTVTQRPTVESSFIGLASCAFTRPVNDYETYIRSAGDRTDESESRIAMTLEDNKSVARRLIRAFDDEDFELMGELLSPDFRYHQNGRVEEGADGFRDMMRRVYAAWQPHRIEIEDEIAEGDRVVLRMTAYDTHSGPYRGLPATGRQLTWSLMFIFRVVGGRIVEIWRAGDDVVRFEQVGLRIGP